MCTLSLEFSFSMLPLVIWILFIDTDALRTLTNFGQINSRKKLYKHSQLMFCEGSSSNFCFVQVVDYVCVQQGYHRAAPDLIQTAYKD